MLRSSATAQNSELDSQIIEFEPGEVNGSLASRFEKVARKFPERPAVRSGQFAWSYSKLNQQANRLAYAIMTARSSHPEPVALLLQPEAPLIASMLGVMKAGKFFSVLETSLPTSKQAEILENLQPALIVRDRQNLELAEEARAG